MVVLLPACTASGGDPDGGTPDPTEAALVCPDGTRPGGAPLVAPSSDATAPPPEPDAPAPPSAEVLDIGAFLPRTGDLAFLAPAPAAGIALAVADIDAAGGVLGAPVAVHAADSAPEVDGGAESEVDRLLRAGVDVVVGPMTSGVTARVLTRVTGAGGLLLSPGARSPALDRIDADGHLFRTATTDDLQAAALAELVLDRGARTASLLVRGDDYGRDLADALATRLEADGGEIASRVDHDPTDPDLATSALDGIDLEADAIVVIGLSESATVLSALAAAGHAPRDRQVYGTDGNLGDRLADLVGDPSVLACLTGVLPVATPTEAFARRLRAAAPALGDGALDHAAEAYDAVALAAVAAEAAGEAAPDAIAAAIGDASRGGAPCEDVATCLARARAGADVRYVGASGPIDLDDEGNRRTADVTVVAVDGEGRLRRTDRRTVGR